MYIPPYFRMDDRNTLIDFIKSNSFGILFSQNNELPSASHLPFLYDETVVDNGILLGHMARANDHWHDIHHEVLVVLSGPHAYISPTWYGEPNAVPTWNYTAVHVYGEFRVVEDETRLKQIMEQSVAFYESSMPNPWQVDWNGEYFQHLLKAIVGFQIHITRIEAKWKLSQNHSPERQQKVIDALRNTGKFNAVNIAAMMEKNMKKTLE